MANQRFPYVIGDIIMANPSPRQSAIYSCPIDVVPQFKGDCVLDMDWRRTAGIPDPANAHIALPPQKKKPPTTLLVNGISVKDIASKYNNFANVDDVKAFFRDIVLQDYVGTDDEKALVVAHLSTIFHQGGIICPARTPIASAIVTDEEDLLIPRTFNSVTNISTTPDGFIIQEIYTLSAVADPANHGQLIEQKDGEPPLLQAEVTLNVDYHTKQHAVAAEPTITVLSKKISYGNDRLQQKLDSRGWFIKVIDFIKAILGVGQTMQELRPTIEKQLQTKALSSKVPTVAEPSRSSSPIPTVVSSASMTPTPPLHAPSSDDECNSDTSPKV